MLLLLLSIIMQMSVVHSESPHKPPPNPTIHSGVRDVWYPNVRPVSRIKLSETVVPLVFSELYAVLSEIVNEADTMSKSGGS